MEPLLFNSMVFGVFLFVIVTCVFVVAQLKRDNSIMDIAYGPIFFLAALGTFLYTNSSSSLSLILLIATGVWALRLSSRIYKKNRHAPEDARYAAWRSAWMQKGLLYFYVRSYLQINLLQGIIIFLVSLPFILSLQAESISVWFLGVGLAIYGLGLAIETTADKELDAFIARKKAGTEPAVLLTTGLFKYSRRPNYFGETLIWWGLAITTLPYFLGNLGLISPLTITYIVTKVTGPMLEDIFLKKYPVEYRAYMETTSYFLPRPPRPTSTTS
jgi:steroid 5-alpha reductase family enzyme